jgi:hypothetical protein
MSSALVCAQPATSFSGLLRPQERPADVLNYLSAIPRLSRVTPAAHLDVRPAPATVSSGLAELDALTGGFPRGCLTEIVGPASSGRTSVLTATLAAATQRQEACALVDVSDAFNPQSAAAAGVEFKNLLWVRCDSESRNIAGKRNSARFFKRNLRTEMACLEQALKVTDLILQSGGFGLVAIDLGDIPLPAARRIPLTSWFRFRRAVENTPAVLLVIGQGPCAGTCTSLLLQLEGELSAISSQLSAKDPNGGRRTVAIHNFSNSQNSWVLHQGRAVQGGKKNCQSHNEEQWAGETAPEGQGDLSPALQRGDTCIRRASPGGTTAVHPHPLREESTTHADIPAHAQLLNGISITAELLRARLERVPAQSVRTRFETRACNRQS